MARGPDCKPGDASEHLENEATVRTKYAFKKLDAAIDRAFQENSREAIEAAITVIQKWESAHLMEQAIDPSYEDADKGIPLFKAVRDALADEQLTNKNWWKLADTLEAILTAIHDSWSQEFLLRNVNYIGERTAIQDESGAWHPVTQTIRDMIENDATYKDVPECEERFDELFRKFRLLTRDEVMKECIRPGTRRTNSSF